MFFLCPELNHFWTGYFSIMSTVLGVNLQTCPLIAIFGIPDASLALNSKQKDIISYTSLLARRSLLLHWKSAKYPSIYRWLKDTTSFLKLEKIKYTLRRCTEMFFHKWQPFISYFANSEVLPNWVCLLLLYFWMHNQFYLLSWWAVGGVGGREGSLFVHCSFLHNLTLLLPIHLVFYLKFSCLCMYILLRVYIFGILHVHMHILVHMCSTGKM